jgi:hypothetical protein
MFQVCARVCGACALQSVCSAQSCPLFNVNLASWNVARVLDASTMFNYASGNRPPNNPFHSSFSQLIAEA